jgi:hypothetical protein
MMGNLRVRLAETLAGFIGGKAWQRTCAMSNTRVDDSPGWNQLLPGGSGGHDRTAAEVQQLYEEALGAWRLHPFAKRYIEATTDYIVGDSILITSENETLQRFIAEFWNHPKNRLDLRVESMCEELTRAGDLFVLLFRNNETGMSYIRFVTKDEIVRIDTLPNDWETEIRYHQQRGLGETRKWLAPVQATDKTRAVMLHYAINRPIGALLGESDIASIIPWLQHYSQMLKDRVRMHWAAKIILWFVTVPAQKVESTRQKYRAAPESGSVIVKDENEHWEMQTPVLHGADSAHDLKAVRGMIDAGSGFPAHYRGEAGDANLATATAMQAPTERKLQRKQKYFGFVLQDILYQAYLRGVKVGKWPELPTGDYRKLFNLDIPDISREDNRNLAAAALQLSQAMREISQHLPRRSRSLSRLVLKNVMKFAGEPLPPETIEAILNESYQEAANG